MNPASKNNIIAAMDVEEPLLRESSKTQDLTKYLSNFAVISLFISYIVSSGALNLPYIVYYAGYLPSSFVLIIVSLLAYVSTIWLLEAEARAESFCKGGDMIIRENKYELSDMCEIFYGYWAKFIYNIILTIYMSCALWSYAAVFADSAAHIVGLIKQHPGECLEIDDHYCTVIYNISLSIFGIICIALTLYGLKEQAMIQNILTIYRYLSFLIMMILAITGFILNSDLDGHTLNLSWFAFKSDGFSRMFTGLVFAQLMQHSVPGLTHPIKDKSQAGRIFGVGFIITTFIYGIISLLLAGYFGADVRSPITLNFHNFSYFGDHSKSVQIVSSIVKFFIICFPLPAVISSFPINAITLGNNLLSMLSDEYLNKGHNRRIYTWSFMLFSNLIPLGLTYIVHEVPFILSLAGSMGFFIMFIVPGLLQYKSVVIKRKSVGYDGRSPDPAKTIYSLPFFSHLYFVLAVIITALIGFVFCVYFVIESNF